MAENPQPPPRQFVYSDTGRLTEEAFRWLENFRFGSANSIGSILSGQSAAAAQNAARIAAEAASRIAGDSAVSGTGDGTGVSDSRVFSAKTSNGSTWVTLVTCMVTPSSSGGDYTFNVLPDAFIDGSLDNEGPAGAVFNGNWRIVEEENGGGTPITLDSGTFTVTYTPQQTILLTYEGGSSTEVVPESWTVSFSGLPGSGDQIATNYDSIVVDLRLEIQRASGTNEITAPGLSGSMGAAWTA